MSVPPPLPTGPSPRRADHAATDGGGLSAEAGGQRQLRVEVFRFDATRAEPPRFQLYEVAAEEDSTLLNVLLRLQEDQDPSLAFRYSCRGLVCGSCAMVVNGRLTLACRTRVADLPRSVVVEPLPGLEVLKDLVVDLDPFWEKYARIRPWVHAQEDEPGEPRMEPQVRDRIDPYSHCILCALCYAACPAVRMHENFAGPAALAKLYRFIVDPRDGRHQETWQAENSHSGVWGCRTATRCIEVCPKNVRPFDGIAGLRRKLVLQTLASLLPGKRHED